MRLNDILFRISYLIKQFWPGVSNSSAGSSIISRWAQFISTHPLILFFILCSLLGLGISLIRRVIR